MKKTISIPEWQQMAKSDNAPPVRIQLNGNSMYPLVRMNRDYVTIVPLEKTPSAGDIVLFNNSCIEKYVVHRVWKTKDGMIQTWGDNCPLPDPWLPLDHVLGKITLIERGKHIIHPEPKNGLCLAKFWHRGGKVYRVGKKYIQAIKRRVIRITSRGLQ